MLKPAKKAIVQTVILCLVTLYIAFPKHAGFMMGFVLLFLIPSLIKSLYYIFIKNIEQKQRLLQTAMWVITCVVVFTHHIYLHKTTRDIAVQVSSRIVIYEQSNGLYPESIEVLGFDEQEMKPYGLSYSNYDNDPLLFYYVTWIPFESYQFDFGNKQWDNQSG